MIGLCNLCGFPVVRINSTAHGTRCLRCRSTQIHRATGLAVAALRLPADARVYELSSRGALFHFLRKRFPDFTCSEFFDDVPPGQKKGEVTCQDVQQLLFPDSSFDLVTSTEVFEHVPDDRRGFREIRRVLKPNGHFIFTVPLTEAERTVERCRLAPDGTLIHDLPPEYHGDRIRGRDAVLAFRNYGLDIMERLRECGLSARLERFLSRVYCLTDQKVLVARKA